MNPDLHLLKKLDPDPHKVNADPKHCSLVPVNLPWNNPHRGHRLDQGRSPGSCRLVHPSWTPDNGPNALLFCRQIPVVCHKYPATVPSSRTFRATDLLFLKPWTFCVTEVYKNMFWTRPEWVSVPEHYSFGVDILLDPDFLEATGTGMSTFWVN
jgi:hypothetical protein